MDYNNWKISVRGADKSITANDVVSFANQNDSVTLFGLRRELTGSMSDEAPLLICEHCRNPVTISRRHKSVFLKHQPFSNRKAGDAVYSCPFYKGKSSPIFDRIEDKSESRLSKFVKLNLVKCLLKTHSVKKSTIQLDPKIIDSTGTGEWRSPDVYFEQNNDQKWAFEVINVWINPQTIEERERFYIANNINLVWLIPEERLNTFSITYGDLMFGSNKNHNVFSLTVKNVRQSRRKKDLFLTVNYPTFDNECLKIKSKVVQLRDLKTTLPIGLPYAVNVDSISYADIRSYLIKSGLITYIRSDDEIKIEAQKRVTQELMRLQNLSKKFICDSLVAAKYLKAIKKQYQSLPGDIQSIIYKKFESASKRLNANLEILQVMDKISVYSMHPDKDSDFMKEVKSARSSLVQFDNCNDIQIVFSGLVRDRLKDELSKVKFNDLNIQSQNIRDFDENDLIMLELHISKMKRTPSLINMLTCSYLMRKIDSVKLPSDALIRDRTNLAKSNFEVIIQNQVSSLSKSTEKIENQDLEVLRLFIVEVTQLTKTTGNRFFCKNYFLKNSKSLILDLIKTIDQAYWISGSKNEHKKIYAALVRHVSGLPQF